MPINRRLAVILFAVTILAVLSAAVYIWMGQGPDDDVAGPVGGLSNYVPAKELKPVPGIQFMDETGRVMTLEDFRGRVVVLNLWATWCTPCVAEMPMLDRLQHQLEGKEAEVVALSIDRGGQQAVKEFYERIGVKRLRIYVDPTMRAQTGLGTLGLPTTLIIDKEGRERGRLMGAAEWDDAAAVELVLGAMEDPK
jgi:thiol-disulfide isomerase/thioredoxin